MSIAGEKINPAAQTMETEPLSIEKSVDKRRAIVFKNRFKDKAGPGIPEKYLRKTPPNLPGMSELDVIRHFTRLSKLNYSVDSNFYPLGSCTMKYNPKINEDIAGFDEFANLHPLADDSSAQGTLEFLHRFEQMLIELCGMSAFTLQPAAGAHGEFTGIMIAKKYFKTNGAGQRNEIIIPDSAHGTNPATASMLGFNLINIKSGGDGRIDIQTLKNTLNRKTAVVMLTIPNTLGIFESGIESIVKISHEAGALVYMDGANFNALTGILKPGMLGIDIMHLNMHKTFSTPHGGGGPGAGAVGVGEKLKGFLPVPRIKQENGMYGLDFNLPDSIGRVKSFFGNTGVLLKAYSYLLMHSVQELAQIAENAVINANYVKENLARLYPPYSKERCMHECVLQPHPNLLKNGIRTIDIAKRLLDYGFYAPTIYFPLIVPEAIMIEPTETESKETLDKFIEAMKKIYQESVETPETVKNAPHTMPVKRLDEVEAARKPNLRW